MNNPFREMLGRATSAPMMPGIGQAAEMARMVQNPQRSLKEMMQDNDMVKKVQQFIQSNGGNPQKVFYALAQQQGADPEMVLNQVRNLMK